jgi:hypothetical protein
VEAQDRLIGNGEDLITGLVNVDNKKKYITSLICLFDSLTEDQQISFYSTSCSKGFPTSSTILLPMMLPSHLHFTMFDTRSDL